MMKKSISLIFYIIVFGIVSTICFFIIHNAEWLVGDDAIIIRHTGWGHFFDPKDTISPETGRFFPMAYTIYNVLGVIGVTSARAHFIFVSVFFVCSSIFLMILGFKSIGDDNSVIVKYITIISVVVIGIQRIYANYLDLYATSWFSWLLILLWCVCCYNVHEKQSLTATIIGLLSVSFLCYCGEQNFVFPLCYGTAGLVFSWKSTSRLEKLYFGGLIGTAMLFLLLYMLLIFPHIEIAYDGDHGAGVSLLGNAFKQLIAQKILLIGLIMLSVRFYKIVVKKDEYEFWDTMILSGFGYCVGCAILKLNWVLYYSSASILILPAITHYLNKYIGVKFTSVVLACLALFMCRKMPDTIKKNQNDRLNTTAMMNVVKNEYAKGYDFYWYEPSDNRPWNLDLELREFSKNSLQTLIGWKVRKEDFKFKCIQNYTGKNGIYVLPSQNERLFPGSNDSISANGNIMLGKADGYYLRFVKIEE